MYGCAQMLVGKGGIIISPGSIPRPLGRSLLKLSLTLIPAACGGVIHQEKTVKATLSMTACAFLLTACAVPSDLWKTQVNTVLEPATGSHVFGTVKFTEDRNQVLVTGEVWGHGRGSKGFHIHEKGDCSDPKALSTGGHYNPGNAKHGEPGSGHAGDLGNLVFDDRGRATINMKFSGVSLDKDAPNSIIGRGLIVHANQDDLTTDPTGNAGERVACGVIGTPPGLTY